MTTRLIGLVLIAAGAGLAWYFGLKPLEEARAGAAEVSYSIKVFVAAPLVALAGAYLLIGGRPAAEAFSGPPQGRQQHLIVWSMFGLALALGGLAFWWFDAELKARGYAFG